MSVPLSNSKKHPIMVGLQFNPHMGRWDISIDVGNFVSESAAREAAAGIKGVLEEHLGTSLQNAAGKVQEVKDN